MPKACFFLSPEVFNLIILVIPLKKRILIASNENGKWFHFVGSYNFALSSMVSNTLINVDFSIIKPPVIDLKSSQRCVIKSVQL